MKYVLLQNVNKNVYSVSVHISRMYYNLDRGKTIKNMPVYKNNLSVGYYFKINPKMTICEMQLSVYSL